MRKFFVCMTLLLGLSLYAPGLADDLSSRCGIENIPDTVQNWIEGSRWGAWEITGWAMPNGNSNSEPYGFAAVKNKTSNTLIAFVRKNNAWKYDWYNAQALPQVEEPILLGCLGNDFQSFYIENEEIEEACCVWTQRSNGTWHLNHMSLFHPLMFYDTSTENALHLYNTGWVDGEETDVWVYGSYQTELRYFTYTAFPKTVEEAQKELSNQPEIPIFTLSKKRVHFPSGKKYEVYQGPGEEYGRAGNGKAVVSTNDLIQVFGVENDWILIQYEIASNHMRIGWITASALPRKSSVSELTFTPVMAKTLDNVDLTDDPICSQVPIKSIPKNTTVNWLATMDKWAYIEYNDSQVVRGFVPTSMLIEDVSLSSIK